MPRIARALAATAVAGAATLAYGGLIERNAFTMRRFDVPVLAPDAQPIRLLHISDLHILTRQTRKRAWIGELARWEPDLVVNTGDTLSEPDGIAAVMDTLQPLFAFPGAFVPGNNDYYAPRPKNPMRYFVAESTRVHGTRLPWPQMAEQMAAAGWVDLTHARATLSVKHAEIALAGTDDPHLHRDRYHLIGGPADSTAAVRIGVTHAPQPYLLSAFARDGYDLVLAGHTHGGQIRIPFGPAIVTNCGIDVRRARWLHQWDEHMYFHICAGLGTNPFAPVRIACRPEASLLTLVPKAA